MWHKLACKSVIMSCTGSSECSVHADEAQHVSQRAPSHSINRERKPQMSWRAQVTQPSKSVRRHTHAPAPPDKAILKGWLRVHP